MPSFRVSAYDPSGKQVFKTIQSAGYTPKQIDIIATEFKKHIHSGKTLKMFVVPKYFEMADPTPAPAPAPKKEMFEKRDISTLNLPENKAMSFACIGSTRSGKSYAVSYLWDKIFKKHVTTLMTLSSHADIYKPFQKKTAIAEGFKKDMIDEAMYINKNTKNHYDFCFIFDDLVLKGKSDEAMTRLLTIGRNSGCSAIISGQKLTMLNATGRSNINYVLCFYQNTDSAIEDTIKCFLRSYFPRDMKLTDCITMYRTLTENHNFFCVDTLENKCFISKINS
jgi:hypothetical protein